MTKPDPSSPLEDDDLLFLTEPLKSAVPESEAPELRSKAPSEPSESSPFTAVDEDRLYTNDFIRQNERDSRILFLSVLSAIALSLGVGVWYLLTLRQAPPQPDPLSVPAPPSLAPLPSLQPNGLPGNLPTNLPTSLPSGLPTAPGQPQPPTDPNNVVPQDSGGAVNPASPDPPGFVPPPPPPESPPAGN